MSAFIVAMVIKPFVLLAAIALLANFRKLIERAIPDGRIKRILLTRV